MKKSLRKTTAVALAVVSTAGIAGATTVATTNHILNTNGTEIVVKADSTISNYLTISNYAKSVKLYDNFTLPTATFVGASNVNVTTYTVTTPSGATFDNTAVSDGKFRVEEIGTYTISYTHDKYVGEITFESSVSTYSVKLVSNNEKILPEKVAIKNGNQAFTGTFNVPEYKVYDENGEVYEDVIVETKLTTPSYETVAITDGKIVFDAENAIEEGYYTLTYYVYENNDGAKGAYLTETKTVFQAVSGDSYKNEFDLKLAYSSEKPKSVNVGKTITLPAVTAKNGDEAVNVYYTVEVFKNGTKIEENVVDQETGLTILKKNDDGAYEFTADEVGVYYRVEYTVKDALGNEQTTAFNIDTVQDNIKPTPIVVNAYDVANVKDLKNNDQELKSIFGKDEAVYIKAIYAEDLGTFKHEDYTFERKIENSSRETIYTSSNKEDANKEIVFNYTGTDTLDESKYVVVSDKTLKNGYYYVYYTVTDAHGNKNSISYKFTVDSNFDWLDENSNEIAPTVSFNDTFMSNIDLGEKVEFGTITASDDKDERLETKVSYAYVVGGVEQTETVVELNDDKKYVINTEEAPQGATKLIIYASATNDGGKETKVSESIILNSENLGTSTPEIYDVKDDGYSYNYVQGSKIVIPNVVFRDGNDGAESLNTVVTVKCTSAEGKVTNYTAEHLNAIKVGDYYYLSNGSFVASTAGNYQVAIKVSDAAGNAVIKFLDYVVTSEEYSGSLRFANIGISDKTIEAGEVLQLTQATIYGKDKDQYGYAVICVEGPTDYQLSNKEFVANKVGEYKLRYVMYKNPANPDDEIQFVEEEAIDFTVTVKDSKAPKVNVNWETTLINGVEGTTNILPAYELGTKILLPKVSASDISGIDFEKSNIVISSSKSNKEIKFADMNAEYNKGVDGEMYYTFGNNAEYTISYNIYDKQGNKSTVSKQIKIGDLIAPTIIVDKDIVESEYKVGQTISIDLRDAKNYINISDNKDTDLSKSDITVKLYVDGNEVKADSTSTSDVYNFTLKSAGEYTLEFSAKDAAGWTGKDTKSFTIQSEKTSTMSKDQVIGTVLIVVSVVVLAGVVAYFIISKKKMDRLYK